MRSWRAPLRSWRWRWCRWRPMPRPRPAGSRASSRTRAAGVLPGATVTLKSLSTGATRSAVSDASGGYTFVEPPAGTRTRSAWSWPASPRSSTRRRVTVGGSVAVNARLEVGQQTEVITVVAEEGAQINTTTQEVATTVTRDADQGAAHAHPQPLRPDLVAGNVAPSGRERHVRSAEPATSTSTGSATRAPTCLLDGSANNDEFTASVGQQVPLDSVQEFSVISSNFSAQYGRASGGIVNVATKSGSNEWHGSAYEYFRPSGLAANDFDANARGQARGRLQAPPARRLARRPAREGQGVLLRELRVHQGRLDRARPLRGADAGPDQPDGAQRPAVLRGPAPEPERRDHHRGAGLRELRLQRRRALRLPPRQPAGVRHRERHRSRSTLARAFSRRGTRRSAGSTSTSAPPRRRTFATPSRSGTSPTAPCRPARMTASTPADTTRTTTSSLR